MTSNIYLANRTVAESSQAWTAPTVNVTRWSTKLEQQINQSLKTVEFFYVLSRTAGKDLSAFLSRYENQLKLETEWVNDWADIWAEEPTWKKVVKRCQQVNRARAKARAQAAKAKAKAEREASRAEAKAAKAKAKAKGKASLRTPAAKAKAKAKPKAITKPTPLPTVSSSISELIELSSKMEEDLRQLDRTFMMQQLAFGHRLRDYLQHLEAKVQDDSWTVQVAADNAMMRRFRIEAARIQLFSSLMLSMGRRRVAGMKYLKEVVRGAPKYNKDRIQTILNLYEGGAIGNVKTAENILERLTSKRTQKIFTDKTDRIFNKLVQEAPLQKGLNETLGKRKPDAKLKNVMSTMILFREKEDDKSERQREQTELAVPVNIDFDEGTTVESAQKQKAQIRHHASKVPLKFKYSKNLKQFYIGQFELRLDEADLSFLRDVENQMLIRKDDATKKLFHDTTRLLKKHNVIFSNLMDTTGESYLAGLYLMNLKDASDQGNTAFIPKKAKSKDTEKLAAFYRFTTTELDLDASTFKEAISKKRYAKDECFINSIYDFYHDNLLRSDKKRNVITRASILKTIGKTEESVKEGLSIEDVLPFFIQHRLTLRVFDKFCKVMFKYDPPMRNHHNKVMYCMMTDGHIYTLNHDVKRLEQMQDEQEEHMGDTYTPRVGDGYFIKEDAKPRPAKMITTIDDILQVVRDMPKPEDPKEKQILTIIHKDDNLTDLLYQLIGAGYSPGVSFESGRITALKLELNKIFCIIQTQQLVKSAIDGVVAVDSEEVYNNMNSAMCALTSKLFLKSHLSYYTQHDVDVLDSYRTKPICGNLSKAPSKSVVEIDVSKAYTAAFCKLTEIPIFNEFDAFKPYGGEPVLPLNLYVVKDFSHPLSTQDRALVYGKYLQEGMDIVAFKQPSFIKQVDYAKLVDELYESKISDDEQQDVYIKKLIANVNIGLLEKGFNRKSVGYLFHDYEECKYYQAQYGGVIHSIQKIEDVSEIFERSPLGLDEGIEVTGPVISYKFEHRGDPYFVLVLKAEKQLRNGFRYIKELLMQGHNFKLMQAYDALASAGVKMYSVKTDCFTIPVEGEAKAREVLTFDQGIGSWRVSKREDIIFPFEALAPAKLDDINFKHLETQTLGVNDEWDVNEMCDHFEKHRRVMVRADYAGCGKSYACKAMEARGHKVLFVCPTNKLAQNNLQNGVTLNMFFGIGMTDAETNKPVTFAKFDDSDYDTIVFDEIYFANIHMLSKIKRYAENNPQKIILATGDTNQLETIDLVSNQVDYETYVDLCINTIFPNSITLHENKRLKTQADKDTLRQFKADIFDESIPTSVTIKRYFKFVSDVKTASNIAYKNSTCESVAHTVRSMLNKTNDYEVGEVLVCRKYLKVNGLKCNVNFEYTVQAVKDGSLVIKGLHSTGALELKLDVMKKHFIHSYCRTCHSFQGSSIEGKMTIFDWRFFFVNRKWLYTAVTRATELKNVFFFSGPVGDYDEAVLDAYLVKKVENYRKQDLQHGRVVTDNFITPAWLKCQFGRVCHDCGDCFRFDIKGKQVDSNLSADRVDNSESHHLNNIVPLCVTCNQRKSCW